MQDLDATPAISADGSVAIPNPYQQTKGEIMRRLGEPVAWISRAQAGSRHRRRRSHSVLLARAETFIAVFFTAEDDTPPGLTYQKLELALTTAVGRRRLKAIGANGQVQWLHLDPCELSARAFLTRPRTFRTF